MMRGQFLLRAFLIFFLSFYIVMASNTMRAVLYEPGGPEKMTIGVVPRPKTGPKMLVIRVFYTALNRADTLQRKGSYPPPPGESEILGLEVAGLVEEIGSSCSLGWKKGDKVMALVPGGGYAEYVLVHETHVMPIPTSYSLSEASAIPEVWLTAYQLLHFIGKIKPGENVLIHAGGSGVGTSLVQLTKLAGANAYVTAGSEEKIKTAISLGAKAGFNYKTGIDFSQWILEQTEGRGVDIITDCVGGSYWEKNAKSLAKDGRWLLYGLLGGGNVNGSILAQLMRKRATLTGTTLRSRSTEYKTDLIKGFAEDVLPYFGNGKLKPIIDTVYPMEKISEAHSRMESNVNTGKILIQVQKDAEQDKTEL
ncbi:quinone oxidoreductase PIG3-like [Actinia tenebrosa]|uniref:Quinone oxidoreductase PIG3-like n=1 Tax=Actinia tenebrosa TaxID=6105 RepID=A0A6P8I8P8_ACTTE|nr:quinone oxidoreductase PIG3-like [Actinia tenebrosa]